MMSLIRRAVCAAACFAAPLLAHAGGDVCQITGGSATPVRSVAVSSVAIELAPANTQFGGVIGVLAQSFDEALSVDNVLARIRIDSCHAMARMATPMRGAGIDSAGYKPQTAFDNTPWRFNMTQNGKRMTADEFDAWMKSRGVRVVGRKDASQQARPAASAPATK